MVTMPPQYSRLERLQRALLAVIRQRLASLLGPLPHRLASYGRSFERQLPAPQCLIDAALLQRQLAEAAIVLVGDFHALESEQESFVQLLRQAAAKSPVMIALEAFAHEDQAAVDAYLNAELQPAALHAACDFHRSWGFSWRAQLAILDCARELNMPVLAMNQRRGSGGLAQRDRAFAQRLARFYQQHQQRQLYALVGEQHLAASHLPQQLRAELDRLGLRPQLGRLLQNTDQLYFGLLPQLPQLQLDPSLAMGLADDCWALIDTPPWARWLSYLLWQEHDLEQMDCSSCHAGQLPPPHGHSCPYDADDTILSLVAELHRSFPELSALPQQAPELIRCVGAQQLGRLAGASATARRFGACFDREQRALYWDPRRWQGLALAAVNHEAAAGATNAASEPELHLHLHLLAPLLHPLGGLQQNQDQGDPEAARAQALAAAIHGRYPAQQLGRLLTAWRQLLQPAQQRSA